MSLIAITSGALVPLALAALMLEAPGKAAGLLAGAVWLLWRA
jgi:hypothetical protein